MIWVIRHIRYYRDIDNYPASEEIGDVNNHGYFTSYASARDRVLDLNDGLPPVYPNQTDFTSYDIEEIERSDYDSEEK